LTELGLGNGRSRSPVSWKLGRESILEKKILRQGGRVKQCVSTTRLTSSQIFLNSTIHEKLHLLQAFRGHRLSAKSTPYQSAISRLHFSIGWLVAFKPPKGSFRNVQNPNCERHLADRVRAFGEFNTLALHLAFSLFSVPGFFSHSGHKSCLKTALE
jgi:hypothetical protein